MDKLIWEMALVPEHTRVLRNMGTCFLLKIEGYVDERRELGDTRVSLKEGSFP